MHTLLSALLACFLNEENVHHVQRGKTVSIETEAILSGNHWLLTGKKKTRLFWCRKKTRLFWCRAIFSPSQQITPIYWIFCGNIRF